MRYLNKIVFINSAAIRYSEVQLDGNIHLIGTQGVGKSTILRAILFFYNADTQRLGIPVEKKSYQDYYFPYADSSIIYEVAREDGWFTVLSYKTMNRICYRFIASPYRPDLFIDEEGAPYPSDRIRSVLDKNGIKYSGAISTYEEYRNILYGNSDNKRDYSCYSLMESGSYQNIIRTIQNVLLNSRLEADYIKQTIITSLNEADSVIDLSRYRSHLSGFEAQLNDIGVFREPGMARKDLEAAKENLRKQYQSSVKPIKEDIYHAEYELEQLAVRKKEDESRLSALRDQAIRLRQEEIRRLEEELNAAEAVLSSIQQEIATLQGKMDRELASLDEQEKDELAALDKELSVAREAISEEIVRKKAELEERKSGYDREQLDSLTASGGDPKRLEEIHSRLAYIGGEIKYINETKALIIEYLKDKREMLDKVPDWTAESLCLQQIIHGEREELKKRLADVNRSIFKVDAELKELKEANRKALENREEYHRSTLLDWFTSRESIFSSMNRTDTDGDCRSLVREITIRISEQSQKLSELRKEITAYTGNFSEDNVFAFKTSFSDDKEYMDFACDLKEFIDEDKVSEYQSRINTRNSDIFRQITSDTKSMVSQEGNIRGVVDQINADFKEKNFVGIIQCIEMRIDPSQNKIVNLLKEIKRFNEEYSWDLGQNLFASSADDTATREKATTLLRELIKSMDAYSGNLIRLADFFDLKFRVIENRNDTGFVERLTNVGSEGTDILVKSMVNIMLLNVFKRNASTVFSDFRLHCMMDEIGKLHPNNVAGILKFANDRDILLINGSPTEQDALSYKHIYKLEKDGDSFTRIRRVITQFD